MGFQFLRLQAQLEEFAAHRFVVGFRRAAGRVEVGRERFRVEHFARQAEQLALPDEREFLAIANEAVPKVGRARVCEPHASDAAGDKLDEAVPLGGVQKAFAPLGEPRRDRLASVSRVAGNSAVSGYRMGANRRAVNAARSCEVIRRIGWLV